MKRFSFLMFALLVAVAASFAQSLGTDKTSTNNIRFKGTDPWADITAFGARSVLTPPSANVSCNGTTKITINSIISGSFQNGDGITILGCGSDNTLPTPGAPTVTPSVAAAMTGTGIVANSARASTPYAYKIVARTKQGALTAAGPQTSISNGQVSLGMQTVPVTSATLSNDVLTLTMSGTTNIVANTVIHYSGSSNAQFSGFYVVSSVGGRGATVVINNIGYDSRALGWQQTDSTSTTGGNVNYFQSNHISWTAVKGAWEYYIYANRDNAGYALIGVTKPTGNDGYQDVQYDDFGLTFTANQTFPFYVPLSTPPTVATNNPLTTTIVSGAGTPSIVVANAASRTKSGQTAVFDDAPAILAAANSISGNSPAFVGGTVFIPSNGAGQSFIVNSYLTLPAYTRFLQAGTLTLNETVEVAGYSNWSGAGTAKNPAQFAYAGFAQVGVNAANPGIYISGAQVLFSQLNFGGQALNGGTDVVSDGEIQTFDYVTFNVGGANLDYLGMGIVIRDAGGSVEDTHFYKSTFTGQASANNTWTPLVYFAEGQDGSGNPFQANYGETFRECEFSLRGVATVAYGGGVGMDADWTYRQGGVMPMFSFTNLLGAVSGNIIVHDTAQDTDTTPLVALLPIRSSFNVSMDVMVAGLSLEAGGIPPLVSGQRVQGVNANLLGGAKVPQNRESVANRCYANVTIIPYTTSPTGPGCIFNVMETQMMGSNESLFWPMSVPTNVVASASGAGTWPATTYSVAVTGVDPSGAETILGIPSTVTVNGSQGIQTTWTLPLGANATNGYLCGGTCTSTTGSWRQIWQHQTGTSLTLTHLISLGFGPPSITTAGISFMNPNGYYTPLHAAPENTPPSGVAGFDLLYGDPAAHQWKMNNNHAGADMVGDAIVEYCGATSGGTQACGKTRELNPIIIFGDVTLNTAKSQSITTLPFTSSSSYSCSGSDLTTAAGIVSFNTYAAASVTIQESGGVNTDHLRYSCVGF